MPNACIAAYTARSCMSQPRHCRRMAPASGTGSFSTASPCRPMIRSCRIEPMLSLITGRWCRLAPSQATVKSAKPTSGRDHDRDDRPVRHLRGQQHPDDEDRRRDEVEEPVREDRPDERRARAGRRVRKMPAKRRHARELTEPPRNDGVGEQPDAERRENVDEPGWCSGGSACPTVSRHDSARNSVDTTFSAKARMIQLQITTLNASRTLPHSGPRHQMKRRPRARTRGARRPPASIRTSRPSRPSSRGAGLLDSDPGHARVDPLEPRSDRRPGVVLDREGARRLPHRLAARLVVDECADGVDERVRIVRVRPRPPPRASSTSR